MGGRVFLGHSLIIINERDGFFSQNLLFDLSRIRHKRVYAERLTKNSHDNQNQQLLISEKKC